MNKLYAFIKYLEPKRAFFMFLVSGVFILTGGCAYFNTYYNAETAFKNARKEHDKFLTSEEDTTQEIPATVISKYERAITKSQKVFEVYPKSKKWHDDALFLMGRAEYYKEEPISAVRRFKQLQKEFAESPHVPQSYLFMGKAYLSSGDLMRAEEAFQHVLQNYSYLNDKEEITLLLAQVAIKREGKAQAIRLLEKTLLAVKTPEKKMEISLQIAELYMELRQYENAIAVLKKAPRKKGFQKLLYRIDYALLISYIESGNLSEALSRADAMARNKRYLSNYSHVALQKGIVLSRLEKTAEALEILEEVVAGDGPGMVRGKAHIELGAIYQFQKEDLEKAREHYAAAVPLLEDEELRELALSRQEAIDELMGLRERIHNVEVTDSSYDYNIGYRIGEIFWLSLEEPDSALHYFSLLEHSAGIDSMGVAKSLYARGWILLHVKQDTATADSLLNMVIRRFPKTEFAQKSQLQLGQNVTIMTRRDSAHTEFLEAEKLYFEQGDAVASTNAYIRVAKKYEDMPIAPTSLYAAAYLCDNVLHKNVTARNLYNRICEEYPEHNLCATQVRPRLAVVEDTLRALGKAPSEDAKNRDHPKESQKNGSVDREFEDVDWKSDKEPPPLPPLPGKKAEPRMPANKSGNGQN